jgi:hypothetical protein
MDLNHHVLSPNGGDRGWGTLAQQDGRITLHPATMWVAKTAAKVHPGDNNRGWRVPECGF